MTPSASIPQSLEDLRKKRALTRSTDVLKSPLNLTEYLSSIKFSQERGRDGESRAKEEREGKMRGALRAMKRLLAKHDKISVISLYLSFIYYLFIIYYLLFLYYLFIIYNVFIIYNLFIICEMLLYFLFSDLSI